MVKRMAHRRLPGGKYRVEGVAQPVGVGVEVGCGLENFQVPQRVREDEHCHQQAS